MNRNSFETAACSRDCGDDGRDGAKWRADARGEGDVDAGRTSTLRCGRPAGVVKCGGGICQRDETLVRDARRGARRAGRESVGITLPLAFVVADDMLEERSSRAHAQTDNDGRHMPTCTCDTIRRSQLSGCRQL
eukprot:3372438-Pyramimonas_sp.AAC.1